MATSLKQELIGLAKRKREATIANKVAKTKTREFKDWQRRCLDRMKSDEIESLKSKGVLFSPVETVYATIEDRSEFVRWALENSEPLDKFLDFYVPGHWDVETARDALLAAINETSFVTIKEHSDPLNALVRQRLDDGQVLPPGVGFRTDEYISQRTS